MASLIRQHGLYYLQFYDAERVPQKRRVPLGVRTKRDAERVRAKLERDHALGTFDPWADDPLTYDRVVVRPERLGESVAVFLEGKRHRATKTHKTYTEVLRRFSRHCGEATRTSQITARDVERWLDTTGANDVSRATYARHLRAFFRWAKEEGLTTTVATEGVRLRRSPRKFDRFLSPDEVGRIAAAARAAGKAWLADVVVFAAHTGLRRGELINLLFEHVDLENGWLIVASTETFTPKGGAERQVPLSRTAAGVITKRTGPGGSGAGGGHVFTHGSGRISPDYLTHAFKKAARDAGIEDVRLHHLRHTACSWLAQRGVPVEAIRRFAGHSSIAVTEKYMHLAESTYREQVATAFDRLLP